MSKTDDEMLKNKEQDYTKTENYKKWTHYLQLTAVGVALIIPANLVIIALGVKPNNFFTIFYRITFLFG